MLSLIQVNEEGKHIVLVEGKNSQRLLPLKTIIWFKNDSYFISSTFNWKAKAELVAIDNWVYMKVSFELVIL